MTYHLNNKEYILYPTGIFLKMRRVIFLTRATLSVAAYTRHIYFHLESAVRFEPYKVT